ncbi:hypothetical protein DM806_25190 [Sphingobium lactosutens]|uniref:hypothetical protein n=1 Tax=Sphingobium lactosutens TaxID=522773 RepID=UPI0015C10B15|nr:hypothetical protein [Sphingobium lactosutens]NWK98898.1 hypothetical protein [Sphingobium lactosutens]
MSSDQRPGKVRVFSSGTAAAPPARRRSDRAEADVTPVAEPSQTPVSAAPPSGGGSLLLAVLFLIGCAVGGVLIAWFGLMPGAGS